MENRDYIYCLRDPLSFRVRYIGRTASPVTRFYNHLSDRLNKEKSTWIKRLKRLGLKPDFLILERPKLGTEGDREYLHIKKISKSHGPLFNRNPRK